MAQRDRKRPRAKKLNGGKVHECPHCKADLRGDVIPLEYRAKGWYAMECRDCGGPNHYSRAIARVDPDLDRAVEYMCPDCGGSWPRR